MHGTPYGEQSQFALSGLVGYSFPGITVKLSGKTDVSSSNYYHLADALKS